MGLFSSKPKKTLFEALNIDLNNLPDETFKIDRIHSDYGKVHHIKLDPENKYFGIFSWTTVIVFDRPGKNIIFSCMPHEFDKYDLPPLIEKIHSIYGKDDDGKGIYSRQDSDEIIDEIWLGRSWTDNKYPIPCSIIYDIDQGLSLTIWT